MVKLGGRERGVAALLVATLFWGTSIVLARILLREISPLILSHLGALVSAAALLIPLAALSPKRLRVEPGDWWRFAVLGGLGFALGGVCINVGIQRTSAATAATLQYLAPAITLTCGWVSRTERATRGKIVAVGLTIVGAAMATGVILGRFAFDPLGVLAGIGSATCFSFITVFSKRFAPRYDPAAFTGYAFLAMGLVYFLVDPTGVFVTALHKPAVTIGIAAYAVFLGVAPTILYFYSLRYVAPTVATIVLAFEIVVTSTLGWIVLGEQLEAPQIIGAAMVIAAVIMIERQSD